MSWAAAEFGTIDLGDKRLDQRAILLAERLGAKPTASLPSACNGWAETQAAYRFFAKKRIDWRDLLAPHWECTTKRMAEHSVSSPPVASTPAVSVKWKKSARCRSARSRTREGR
jgi:hypothetical protein